METGARATADRHVDVIRVTEDDWRQLRDVRLAALRDAPTAFGSTWLREEAFDEDRWRGWARSAGLFIAYAGSSPVGMAAGVPGESSLERQLVSMWVDPGWRGSEAAPKLMLCVIGWAESEGSDRLRLWGSGRQ